MKQRFETCQCGCGSPLPQSGVGRSRKYLNNTHKSAANNQKTRELVKRGKSIKDAVLLRHIVDNMEIEDISAWYPDLTDAQWVVIEAIRATPLTYDAFSSALSEMAGW